MKVEVLEDNRKHPFTAAPVYSGAKAAFYDK
jgi:hypothetical protein